MANHARIKNITPTVETVNDCIENVISNNNWNEILTVNFTKDEGEPTWIITLKDDKFERVLFWINSKSEIESRHGHGSPIYWFLEDSFMKYFTSELGGKLFDDGVGYIEDLGIRSCIDYFPENCIARKLKLHSNKEFYGKYFKQLGL